MEREREKKECENLHIGPVLLNYIIDSHFLLNTSTPPESWSQASNPLFYDLRAKAW